jgi:drug/metabolite transporter (DMT)-like permease
MLNQNPLRAALWMSCAVLAFSFMAVAAREMLRHMEAFEILFLRTLVTMVLVLAVVARSGTATLRTRLFRFHLARALMHLGGQSRPCLPSSSPCRCGSRCSRRRSSASA